MALKLWMGPSGSGKTRFLFEYVLGEAAENPNMNYYLIVPEQFTLSTQRELISLSKDHGILNVDVLSFARLAYRIFEETGFKNASGINIDDMGKNLILRHLASKYQDDLSVLSGNINKLGYITEVKSAISEFMQYGIDINRLSEMIEKAEESGRLRLAAKLSDMKILYEAFNSYIDEKYITKEEILNKAARAVFDSEKIKNSVVIFDGFTGFTPVQYDLISSIMQIAHDIHVTILTDTRDIMLYNTEHELFYLGYKTSEKLKNIAELNNIKMEKAFEIKEEIPRRFVTDMKGDKVTGITNEMLVHLERNLFREYSKPYKRENSITGELKIPTKAVNGGIALFSGLQPIDEVTKVAVEIQKLIRSDKENGCNHTGKHEEDNNNIIKNTGLRFKDIAIATGDLETYSPIIERVFEQYDIPFFIDKNMPVVVNPIIEYIRALLDIITENFSYSAVFRYLRSPLSDYETSDIDKLENFILKYGIKGSKTWKEDWIEKYSRYYKTSTKNDKNNIEDELKTYDSIREKVVLELKYILDLITGDNRKAKKKPTKMVNEINAVIISTFEMLGIEKRIEMLIEKYSKTDVTFEDKHKKEYEKIYGLVIELLNRMSELLGDEQITFDEYGELLDAGFDEIRIGTIPTITDYIQIGDITRSRFQDIQVLFIVGANDGIIPKSGSSGGIISDIEKEFLITNTPDIELSPTIREQAYTGQLYLYMLMTKPKSKLYLSYSRISSDGEALRPSYIFKIVTDMFPTLKISKDFNTAFDKIYNYKSAYDVLAQNIRNKEFESVISLLLDDEYINKFIQQNGDFNASLLETTREESLIKLADAAYSSGIFSSKDSISESVAGILYGKAIIGSVTRLEQYAKCSFSYYLKYGLSLKERELFGFEAKDMGTVFHGVIEKYSKMLLDSGISWEEVDENERIRLVSNAVNECILDSNYSVLNSSFRHKYLVERITRISLRSIGILTDHIKAGKFRPRNVELSFSSVNSLDAFTFKLSDDEIMRLSGTIDRLDTYEGDDNKLYVKIIDYKSSDKNLNLIEVYKGLSLQLVVYMNAAMELTGKDSANKDKEIIPAGILYYHIDDPIVEGSLDEDNDVIYGKIMKELKMKGLVNSNKEIYSLIDSEFEGSSNIIPVSLSKNGDLSKNSSAITTEEFDIVSRFVKKKIADIGRDILSGNIKAEPHTVNGTEPSGCAYCNYADICKYDGYILEDKINENEVVDKDNVIIKMKEEADE